MNVEKYTAKQYYYTDTQGHWAEKAISLVTASGYMQGYQDNSFKPEKNITREEVATVLSNMNLQIEETQTILKNQEEKNDVFLDMKTTDWSYHAVIRMAELGVLKGYENGKFEPKKDMSREEMAVILSRTF